jgi:predicted nucleic acid-binding protein
MRKRLVLVDSSIWIRFFRTRTPDPTCSLLETLLRQKRVAILWLIRLELLSGTTTPEAYDALDRDLAALRQLALSDELFRAAGRLRWHLGRQGVTVPIVDSVIAACALVYDCLLLHDDQHFTLIARHAPLRIHPPPLRIR